ncbi:MAG: oligosaccharide flippase family protein [Candidatus Aminicenantes bacterium]|nr:oligosaccharide flippase family protein [Candidatus Aminicenantes bacterium]
MMTEKLGKNLFLTLGAFLFFIATGYVIHIYLGRSLGPEEYGVFGVVISLLAIVEVFFLKGMRDTVAKYVSEYPQKAKAIKNKGLKLQMYFAGILGVLFFVLSPYIAALLRDESLAPYLRLVSLIVPFVAVHTIYLGYLSGIGRFGQRALVVILYCVVKVVAVFLLVFLGFGVKGAIFAYLLGALFGVILSVYFTHDKEKVSGYFPASQMIAFALPLIFFSGAKNLLMTLDLLFVKVMIQENSAAGLYTAAMMLTKVPHIIFLAFTIILLPAVSKATSVGDGAQTSRYINSSLKYLLILLLPILFFLASAPREIMELVYSEQYVPAAEVLVILIFGISFITVFSVLTTVVTGSGRPKTALAMVLVLVPLDVVLNLILIPRYALRGAAWATTVTCFLGMIISLIYVRRKFGPLLRLRSFLGIVAASSLFYLGPNFLPMSGPLLILQGMILSGFYVLVLFAVKEISPRDFGFIRESVLMSLERNNKP